MTVHNGLMTGIVTPGVYLVGNMSGIVFGLSLALLTVYQLTTAAMFFLAFAPGRFVAVAGPVCAPPKVTSLKTLYAYLAHRSMVWEGLEAFRNIYGSMFSAAAEGREWFVMVQFVFSLSFSVLMGMPSIPCQKLAAVATLIHLVNAFVISMAFPFNTGWR